MSETISAKTAEAAKAGISVAETTHEHIVGVRVSPNGYLTALLIGIFFSAFLIYLELDMWAAALLACCALVVPPLALTDRITFDGRRLRRTGLLPRFWGWLNGYRYRLKLSDIEQIETQARRAAKRGGNVFYRYRTIVAGAGMRFVFTSGGDDYRRLIQRLLPRLTENVLDNRSLELRDYLAEPKEVLMKAEFARIPAADVLEDAFVAFGKKQQSRHREILPEDYKRADYLRRLANELRLAGYLPQALEAFRRALVIQPRDGWLIFETARCLHSFASVERNELLRRKSFALLRLAERRAAGDGELLARLGETYFQFGDCERARGVFQRSVDRLEESFRSVRGLAEIALREGKIAHVIHHFAAASRLAETPSLRRWTESETDYFSHLNADDDYMEMEIRRLNLLETLERSKRTALRIALCGFPAILIGIVLADELVAQIGWAVSAVALLIWSGLTVGVRIFADRIPYELIESED